MGFHNTALIGSSGQGGGYNLESSLRFRSSANAYLNRTPASAGNRKTWTWSGWVKRGTLGSSYLVVYGASISAGSTEESLVFWNDFLYYRDGVSGDYVKTSAVFRDPSAWYHVVFVYDSANATQANRGKFYVNGVQQTLAITSIPLNRDSYINSSNAQAIGRFAAVASNYFDGYLTEINFIDGQALDPTSFGEYDATTGVWKPKEYTGTYGTNGFYLNFSDGTSTTTLGYDQSPNSNNWTTNNISLTAGVTYDLMNDVPTLTDEDTANFCTLNPLNKGSASTISNGNLQLVTGLATSPNFGTIQIPITGKWYWEYVGTTTGDRCYCGIANSTTTQQVAYYGADGNKYVNGTGSAYGATYTTNDLMGVAVDSDAGTITFYKNNVSQGDISYSISDKELFPYFADGSGSFTSTIVVNFGQRPFAYTPPTGYKKLNTYNLPDSTIKDGSKYMNTVLYTGNGTSQSVTGVGFSPDLVWIKSRSNTSGHNVFDTIRTAGYYLLTNQTNAEANDDRFTSFDSDGFTVDATTTTATNGTDRTFAAWNWRASDSDAVVNTDGTITSTVSVNPTSGFSIVTYTNASSGSQTVGHGLGTAPNVVIVKLRSTTSNWFVYHSALGPTKNLYLDSTSAENTQASIWNNTAPTPNVFNIGTAWNGGATAVAYCFAEVEGFSKFGSYTGNGSADGPFIYTGFRPAFLLVKRTDSAGNWQIYDTSRDTYNWMFLELVPNSVAEENSGSLNISVLIDAVSNGFKLRATDTSGNASGGTYIFMCFAENPFKNSLAR